MVKLRKDQFIPFLDVSGTGAGAWVPVWKRIDRSTVFSLDPNPQTVTRSYISCETAVEEIDRYQPKLPQEIALYEGDPVYDLVFDRLFMLPVGDAAKVPLLLCFGGSGAKAWLVRDCVLVPGELDTVGGKLSFSLHLGGDIERGVFAVADGVPQFCPAA